MSDAQATILTMDDAEILREAMTLYLENKGFRVLQAENGRIGLELVASEHPDLVLVDLRMPEMDGMEVLARLREIAPDTPSIVVSGTGRLHDALEAIRLGAWDFVTKPMPDMDVLLHAVNKALDRARLMAENARYQKGLETEIALRTRDLEDARSRLEEQNLFLQTLIESIPNPLFCQDRDGRFLGGNESFCRLMGLGREKLAGRVPEEVLPPSRAGLFARVDLAGLARTGPVDVETAFVAASGEVRHLVLGKSVFPDASGQPAGMVGVLSDFTALERARELAERALEEKNVLLKEIHHRVKNNLQIILGFISIQAEDAANAAERERFSRLETRIRSMALIHQQLYQQGDLATIDMGEYAQALTRNLSGLFRESMAGVRLAFDCAPCRLRLDKAVPCGLLLNELVTNACKHAFRPGQPGELRVATGLAGGLARISVVDTGRGLSPGFTLDATQTMGMTLVKELTRQLQGEVRLENRGGLHVEVRFPL